MKQLIESDKILIKENKLNNIFLMIIQFQ